MTQPTKMELPSVTLKKQTLYNEMHTLYNDSYNNLTQTVTTVGAIVQNRHTLDARVDQHHLDQMIRNLSGDIDALRHELNAIYSRIVADQNQNLDLMDLNMACIQHSADFQIWGERYAAICSQQLGDILTYVGA